MLSSLNGRETGRSSALPLRTVGAPGRPGAQGAPRSHFTACGSLVRSGGAPWSCGSAGSRSAGFGSGLDAQVAAVRCGRPVGLRPCPARDLSVSIFVPKMEVITSARIREGSSCPTRQRRSTVVRRVPTTPRSVEPSLRTPSTPTPVKDATSTCNGTPCDGGLIRHGRVDRSPRAAGVPGCRARWTGDSLMTRSGICSRGRNAPRAGGPPPGIRKPAYPGCSARPAAEAGRPSGCGGAGRGDGVVV